MSFGAAARRVRRRVHRSTRLIPASCPLQRRLREAARGARQGERGRALRPPEAQGNAAGAGPGAWRGPRRRAPFASRPLTRGAAPRQAKEQKEEAERFQTKAKELVRLRCGAGGGGRATRRRLPHACGPGVLPARALPLPAVPHRAGHRGGARAHGPAADGEGRVREDAAGAWWWLLDHMAWGPRHRVSDPFLSSRLRPAPDSPLTPPCCCVDRACRRRRGR